MTCERMMLPKYHSSSQAVWPSPGYWGTDSSVEFLALLPCLIMYNNVASVVVWLWYILDEDIEVCRYYDEYVAIGN